MIDQNNEIIQELKKRTINENGSIYIARQNNYNDLIDETKKEIYNNKKTLKFEKYVEWLENEVLYQTYKSQWRDNQRLYTEKRLLQVQKQKEYANQCIQEIQDLLIKRIDEKEGKQ